MNTSSHFEKSEPQQHTDNPRDGFYSQDFGHLSQSQSDSFMNETGTKRTPRGNTLLSDSYCMKSPMPEPSNYRQTQDNCYYPQERTHLFVRPEKRPITTCQNETEHSNLHTRKQARKIHGF